MYQFHCTLQRIKIKLRYLKYSYHIKPNFRRLKNENAIVLLDFGADIEHGVRTVSQDLERHIFPHVTVTLLIFKQYVQNHSTSNSPATENITYGICLLISEECSRLSMGKIRQSIIY